MARVPVAVICLFVVSIFAAACEAARAPANECSRFSLARLAGRARGGSTLAVPQVGRSGWPGESGLGKALIEGAHLSQVIRWQVAAGDICKGCLGCAIEAQGGACARHAPARAATPRPGRARCGRPAMFLNRPQLLFSAP